MDEMKTMKSIFTIIAATSLATFGCSCASGKGGDNNQEPKVLVAYFSAQGHTKAVAEKVAAVTGGTLFEIEPLVPYSEADLDGWSDSSRSTLEARDRSRRPEIKSKMDDFDRYDVIYLGFPIWWYTAPTIINTFLENYNTEGKTIVPFATSGGSGYGETEKDLIVSAPKATFKPGKVLNTLSEEEIKKWIDSLFQ